MIFNTCFLALLALALPLFVSGAVATVEKLQDNPLVVGVLPGAIGTATGGAVVTVGNTVDGVEHVINSKVSAPRDAKRDMMVSGIKNLDGGRGLSKRQGTLGSGVPGPELAGAIENAVAGSRNGLGSLVGGNLGSYLDGSSPSGEPATGGIVNLLPEGGVLGGHATREASERHVFGDLVTKIKHLVHGRELSEVPTDELNLDATDVDLELVTELKVLAARFEAETELGDGCDGETEVEAKV